MPEDVYIGHRLSYSGAPCSVRYIGQVQGTKGTWLGVEWDDPGRGRHAGDHQGVKYFDCQSKHPTAGSFIRPTRPIDQPLSFLEAFRKKYAPDATTELVPEVDIEISGKIVEEVGFEKIRQQLASLHELRIVLLDGLCIAGVQARPWVDSQTPLRELSSPIEERHLKIVELDISRNLLEQWADVVGICGALKCLRRLKVNGNRFKDLCPPEFDKSQVHDVFKGVKELGLDDTLLSWDEIVTLTTSFPNLTTLSASSNNLTSITSPLLLPALTNLTLSSNALSSFANLTPITDLPHLKTLSLRSNLISTVHLTTTSTTPPLIFPHLQTLDLSSNALETWAPITTLPTHFPRLLSLLTSQNPLFAHPPIHPQTLPPTTLLTIARIPTLTSLNHTPIPAPTRQNAELYYLSQIALLLSTSPQSQESLLLSHHPRYPALCALHGPPTITRPQEDKGQTSNKGRVEANTLAARLVEFTFYLAAAAGPDGGDEAREEKRMEIPRTVDVYRIKGIVGRLFGVRPLGCRLVLETGEWDPVGGAGDDEGWSCSEDEDDDESGGEMAEVEESGAGGEMGGQGERQSGKWVRREVELVDSTREVGFWIEGRVARVRVEMRQGIGN